MSGRVRAGLAALVLVGGLVGGLATGCSEDRFEAYCDEVQAQQEPLTEALAQGAQTGLLAALTPFEALQDKAPDDIADDWGIVVQRVRTLGDALDGAGVDPATYDPDAPPADLSDTDRAAIDAAAAQLLSPASRTALANVEQQARDVCGTPLNL